MSQSDPQPKPNANAEQAFLDYVALGPSRSIASLVERYQTATKPPPTKRLQTLKEWSVRYHWQTRLSAAVTVRSEALLQEAIELDAATFAMSSRKLNDSISTTTDVQEMIRIRESVRKPVPKVGAEVNVAVNLEIRQLAERVAREEGMDINDLLADAEQIAASAWSDG